MAQIETESLDVIQIQGAMSEGSAVTSSAMIGTVIAFLMVAMIFIFFAAFIHNAARVREDKMSIETITVLFRNIAIAVTFFVITTLLIGVFYVF